MSGSFSVGVRDGVDGWDEESVRGKVTLPVVPVTRSHVTVADTSTPTAVLGTLDRRVDQGP